MVRTILVNELAQLSSAERILLAQDLWDSVAEDADAWDLTPQQRRELDRRIKSYRARKEEDKSIGASWEQVKRRIRRQA